MKTKWPCAFACLLAMAAALPAAHAQQPMTRAQFAQAMHKVKAGMTTAEVTKILGKPDDIITEFDPVGDDSYKAETWCYGTDGHLSYPTLGRVYLSDGVVRSTEGGDGTPPDPSILDEAALRKLLRLIAACATDANPRHYIEAVNTLLPLGKEKALAVISEFLRVGYPMPSTGKPVHFLLLRLLFDVPPDAHFVSEMYGELQPDEPADPKVVPYYPIALVDDIPLDLVSDYLFPSANRMLPPDPIGYFRKHSTLRKQPLRPGDDPLVALAALEQSPQWIYRDKPAAPASISDRYYLIHQLLQLVNTVYRIPPDDSKTDESREWIENDIFMDKRWEKVVKDVAALHIRWDPEKSRYVFADGTTLPEIKPPVYMRQIWYLPQLAADARLVILRDGKNTVSIRLYHNAYPGVPVPEAVVRVHRTGPKEKTLKTFHVDAEANGNAFHISDWYGALPAGESVQAEITSGGKTVKSAVFTP